MDNGTGTFSLLSHFWKVFSIVCLGLVSWMVYEVRDSWNHRSVLTYSDPNLKKSQSMLIHSLDTGNQSRPAHVVFKNRETYIDGYFVGADDQFILFSSVYTEKGEKTEKSTILIPWENVLFIRVNTESDAGKRK